MRELTMTGVDVTPWTKGVVVSGKYINAKKLANADSILHYFENAKGRSAVWGSTVLDGSMLDVKPTDYVVIRCEGVLSPKKGGQDYWGFRVSVLEGDEVKAFESGKLTPEAIFKSAPAGREGKPKQ